MSEELENWREQARADLFIIWDALSELEVIADRISKALDEDNYELYRRNISDFTGLEEGK